MKEQLINHPPTDRQRAVMTAVEELKLRLAETLSTLTTGTLTGDVLKDHWWQICYAMKPAIAELRQQETLSVAQAHETVEATR
jgi:hypothetical protein